MIISTYDKVGNITTICENGVVIARYVYDGLNRLISENNSQLNEKIKYEYDHAGNIVCKSVNGKKYKYSYPISGWRDQLLSYNGEECEYDAIGNPTKYRNRNLVWQGRRLQSIGSGTSLATYTYDVDSVRTSKTVTDGSENFTCKYVYDGNTLLGECRNNKWIYYIYGVDGIAGFRYNGVTYLYRKNIQGDITHIYEKCEDGSLKQVAHYAYDAFGNFKILQGEDENSIANINPFRYRGYYYDTETGLYYLISRYYDPETDRFISADSIEYLDPETLGGLNLYAYCCNNPVMMTDENGNMPKWLKWLIAGVATVILVAGAVVLTVWSGGTFATPLAAVGAKLFASTVTGAAVSATLSLSQSIASGDIDLRTFGIDIGIGALSGAIAFGAGEMLSIFGKATGLYLNEMVIGGLRVGDVFGNALPALFKNTIQIAGGVLAGMFIDKNLDKVFKRSQGSLQNRFLNNIKGGVFSSFLEFIKYLW